MTNANSEALGPLAGIRVIGLEQYIAGPYCTLLLADAGAEVIKIERPGIGDRRRAIPPYAETSAGPIGAGFLSYNRNKKSVALDLKTGEGRAVYRDLVGASDVVVENMRPGVADGLGLGYESLRALNSRLVYAAISGFGRLPGREGPLGDRPAFDVVAEAMSGIMHLVGFEDRPPSGTTYGMPDIYSGLTTAYGIMLALFARTTTGEGQFVDSALYDNMLSLNEGMIATYSVTGRSPRRGRPENTYPRGAVRTRDGYIALSIPDETMWRRLCGVLERPDLLQDPRTCDSRARVENFEFVDETMESFFSVLTRDEAVGRLLDGGIPAGPVQTAEDVFACPQAEARGMLMTVDDPDLREFKLARTPLHFSAAPEPARRPPPRLGEHTGEVLREVLGYSDERVRRLAEAGTIGLAARSTLYGRSGRTGTR